MNTTRFVSGGYFVSRFTGEVDCTGTRLCETTMAASHNSRRFFFPDA